MLDHYLFTGLVILVLAFSTRWVGDTSWKKALAYAGLVAVIWPLVILAFLVESYIEHREHFSIRELLHAIKSRGQQT